MEAILLYLKMFVKQLEKFFGFFAHIFSPEFVVDFIGGLICSGIAWFFFERVWKDREDCLDKRCKYRPIFYWKILGCVLVFLIGVVLIYY